MCHELAQATADPDGSTMDDVVKDADRLVSCLANKAIILSSLIFALPTKFIINFSQLPVVAGGKNFRL